MTVRSPAGDQPRLAGPPLPRTLIVTLPLPSVIQQNSIALSSCSVSQFADELRSFCDFGSSTVIASTAATLTDGSRVEVPTYLNEFWTARQRAAHSLHEISYRACFKPQLPRFFIQRLTEPGELVYDPFMGRGTTVIEAALLNRIPCGCDINPLSVFLTKPRLEPPSVRRVDERL